MFSYTTSGSFGPRSPVQFERAFCLILRRVCTKCKDVLKPNHKVVLATWSSYIHEMLHGFMGKMNQGPHSHVLASATTFVENSLVYKDPKPTSVEILHCLKQLCKARIESTMDSWKNPRISSSLFIVAEQAQSFRNASTLFPSIQWTTENDIRGFLC